ncbi:MAG: hypothetical protein PHI12_13570 [Dehalococcoidales bacterium]|nr:hypothetical protein [Dehalococcoidales bacterium]
MKEPKNKTVICDHCGAFGGAIIDIGFDPVLQGMRCACGGKWIYGPDFVPEPLTEEQERARAKNIKEQYEAMFSEGGHGSGACAKCGSMNLHYSNHEVDEDELIYYYECDECGHHGTERYLLGYNRSD